MNAVRRENTINRVAKNKHAALKRKVKREI
jgi:hypothetical protein